jgi:hypothetical protein
LFNEYDLEYFLHEQFELLVVDKPALVVVEVEEDGAQFFAIDLESGREGLFELLEGDLAAAVQIKRLERRLHLLVAD